MPLLTSVQDTELPGWYLCGCTDAEDDAKHQLGLSRGDEHQITQNPGQAEYDGHREADEDLLPQSQTFGAEDTGSGR